MANILIVEDEDDIAELYRIFLESAGHTIVGVFGDPAVALDGAARRGTPDLVILDERLGSRSGSAYLASFRAAFAGARVLLVSADPDAVRNAEHAGFDEGKRKPVTLQHLIENIDGLLSRPARAW
jgi:DNA-binding response OmpR family regulator